MSRVSELAKQELEDGLFLQTSILLIKWPFLLGEGDFVQNQGET